MIMLNLATLTACSCFKILPPSSSLLLQLAQQSHHATELSQRQQLHWRSNSCNGASRLHSLAPLSQGSLASPSFTHLRGFQSSPSVSWDSQGSGDQSTDPQRLEITPPPPDQEQEQQQQQQRRRQDSSSSSRSRSKSISDGDEDVSGTARMILEAFGSAQQGQPSSTTQSGAAADVLSPHARQQRPSPFRAAAQRQAASNEAAAAAAAEAAVAAATPPQDAIKVLMRAVENCMPLMKLMQIKKGSRIAHAPVVIRPSEQRSLATRWIMEAARKRKKAAKLKTITLADCLAAEVLLAAQGKGAAREKRDTLHKLGMENRALLGRA